MYNLPWMSTLFSLNPKKPDITEAYGFPEIKVDFWGWRPDTISSRIQYTMRYPQEYPNLNMVVGLTYSGIILQIREGKKDHQRTDKN